VAHPVFKTGRASQPGAWKVRLLRRSVPANRPLLSRTMPYLAALHDRLLVVASFEVGATAFAPAIDDVGKATTPAPQSEPVPQTSRPRGAGAPLVAIGSGLSIPAAGPARFRQYSEPAHLTRIPPTGWSPGAASSDCPVPTLRHARPTPNAELEAAPSRASVERRSNRPCGGGRRNGSSARDRGRGRPRAP
jgi:hypothetical protein